MRVGKKLRNKNGFTLIELIAVIFIMGIMLILSLPQVSKIQQANKNKKYETYEKSIERGAKLYTDSNARDMFGNNNSGCVTIPYSALKSSNVIKDFGDNDIICSVDSESYVQIRKINDDYRYDVALTCRQDGEVVYQETVDNTFTCTNSPDTEVPEIEANPSSKDWVRTQDLEITIKISDESGLNRNTSIKYYWVKTSGEKVGKEYTHNYNNKKGVTKVSYKIPKKNMIDTTGQYYLVVEPYRTTTANGVQDALGNDRITEERFGIYKIDNTKPSCGVADGEKTKWTNTDFTITQHCSDGESGCVKESYSKKFTESTTTHTFTIKDKAGNTNKCKVNVYLDKDKPTCGKTKGESTEWTNKDRTISVECEEKEFSKCKKDVFEVTFSTDGKKDNIEIQDNAGNKTQCSVNKYIDKTPPKCPTISSTTPAGKWTNKDITYTFKFTDDTAKYIWYTKVGDNDWKEWSTNKPSVTQKSITAEGYRKVGVRVYDAVGNHQLCGTDATYNIDKSKPTCGTASGSSTTWINKDRYISQGCNDSLSGCSAPTFNKTFTTEGTTDKISIADKAGNSNTCTVNKYIDKTRPTLGYKLTQDTTGQPYKSGTWTRNGVFRDLYPADKGGSGVLETQYNLGGGWDHEPNLSNFYIGEGNQTGRYRVIDNAGNISDEVTIHYMIDWTAPACPSISSSIPANTWTNQNIDFTFGFSGDTTKYTWYTRTRASSGWQDWINWGDNNPSTRNKTISGEGLRKVGVRVYDAAGNNQLCGADPDYKIDKTAPYTPYLDRNATAILDGVVVLANVYGKCDAACFAAEPGRQNSVILQQNGTPCFEQLDCNVSPHSKSVGKCYFSKKWPCGDHQWTAEDDYSHAADVSGIKSISRLSWKDHGCLNERNQGDYSETHYYAVDNAGNVSADLKVTILNTALYPAAVLHKYYEVRDYEWKLRSGMTRPERQNSSCFS